MIHEYQNKTNDFTLKMRDFDDDTVCVFDKGDAYISNMWPYFHNQYKNYL